MNARRLLLVSALLALFVGTCCAHTNAPETLIAGLDGYRLVETDEAPAQLMYTPWSSPDAGSAGAGSPDAGAGTETAAKIVFEGEVNEKTVTEIINAMVKIQFMGINRVILEINSGGGLVDQGFRLSKYIESSTMNVTCVVDGEAASMGYYILQSCDYRVMTRRSTLMIHDPFVEVYNLRLTRRELEYRLRQQDHNAYGWMEHAGHRLKISVKELRKRVRRYGDYELNCDEALEIGAVDELVTSTREVFQPL